MRSSPNRIVPRYLSIRLDAGHRAYLSSVINACAGDLVAPEILETRWRQLRVPNGALDILVPEIILD
jgi:hypothetical protein